MKSNREMTEQEFAYTSILKRSMNDLLFLINEIEQARTVAPHEDAEDIVNVIETGLQNVRYDILHALKTVGT